MKFFVLSLLFAAASAADCTDANVVAKTKLRDEAKKAFDANAATIADAKTSADDKKAAEAKTADLKKASDAAAGALIVAQNTCTPGDASPEPVDAQSQLAKSNNAKAVTDLKEWGDLTLSESKQKGGYDKLDAAAKLQWDAKHKTQEAAKAKRDEDEKLTVGFAKMTVEQQTIFLGNQLSWKKDQYKICQANPTSSECKLGNELRAKQIKKRVADKYWTKSKDERTKDDAASTAASKANLAEIVAAAKPVVKPVEKVTKPAGTACAKDAAGARPTCAEGHCCGIASKGFFGGKKEQCHPKAATTVKIESEDWNFSCITGAKQLASGLATAMIASYMMA